MDTLVAVWTTDGLSAGVDWYCGGDGEDRSEPEEFCVGALTDDAAWCDPGDADAESLKMTVGEAHEGFSSLAAAAVSAYADDHTLPDDVSVAIEAAVCDDVAAVTTDEATEIVCLTPNG